MHGEPDSVRLDKWLWAARLFKTRAQAAEAVNGGKVHVDGQRAKPSKPLRVGMTLEVNRDGIPRVLVVRALSDKRGPAKAAQTLYEETEESIRRREALLEMRRLERAGMRAAEHRPDKRGRRQLRRLKGRD